MLLLNSDLYNYSIVPSLASVNVKEEGVWKGLEERQARKQETVRMDSEFQQDDSVTWNPILAAAGE